MSIFILGANTYTSYSYIILPYCPNGTIIDLLMKAYSRGTRLSMDLALYLFKQLLLCLSFLHNQNGLAHLDIKPDNLVITDDYKVSLIDFGHTNQINQLL